MSGAFKILKKSDVQILPYTTNKFWTLNTSSLSSLGIKSFIGCNTSSLSSSTTDSGSGVSYKRNLVYNSIKQLYYSNYISSSYFYLSSSFDNFDQTTVNRSISSSFYLKLGGPSLSFSAEFVLLGDQYNTEYNGVVKYFPTASGDFIRVLTIPKNIFGNKIVPGTFNISSSYYNIIDDKEGNLFDNKLGGDIYYIGNIIYPHGIVVITHPGYLSLFQTSSNDQLLVTTSSISLLKNGNFNLDTNWSNVGSESALWNISGGSANVTTIGAFSASKGFTQNIPDNIISLFSSIISYNFIQPSGTNLFFEIRGYNDGNPEVGDQLYVASYNSSTSGTITNIDQIDFAGYNKIGVIVSSDIASQIKLNDLKIYTVIPDNVNFNLSFRGEYIIYENEIRCNISEDEFNFSSNPSIISDNSGSLRDFSTASFFNPYVTTVGLYNEAGDLLVVGKLAKPVPMSKNSDLTYIIKYDS